MTVAQTSLNLQGKVALVTGSAKRLGRCIALHLAQQGADVVVHFHNSAPDAGAVVAEIIKIGRRAISVQADLANTSEIQSLFARAIQEFGRLDILVNNASNFLHTEFETTSEETWDASLDVNLKA
jgi:NAD(P)-dependent dehydrogenase (short-subunit alcohol dehydrogenase family)